MDTVDILCIGGAHVDLIARSGTRLLPATSNPGTVTRRIGGVAFNVARGLAARHRRVALAGIVGDDDDGRRVRAALDDALVTDALIMSPSHPTGRYIAIEDHNGALAAGVAETAGLDAVSPQTLLPMLGAYRDARWWFADANLPEAALQALAAWPNRPKLALDAVSVAKASRLADLLEDADLLFCNTDEAAVLPIGSCPAVVITDGASPVRVIAAGSTSWLDVPRIEVRSVTGAGDRLIAATLDRLLAGEPLARAVKAGIQAATSLISAKDDAHEHTHTAR
ncbi:MAG: hypothetical protein HQ481_11390 [Alphaproteobacteria bacterium]|nr:hypothetical protein [Alphaproteobacteria bacterium]